MFATAVQDAIDVEFQAIGGIAGLVFTAQGGDIIFHAHGGWTFFNILEPDFREQTDENFISEIHPGG